MSVAPTVYQSTSATTGGFFIQRMLQLLLLYFAYKYQAIVGGLLSRRIYRVSNLNFWCSCKLGFINFQGFWTPLLFSRFSFQEQKLCCTIWNSKELPNSNVSNSPFQTKPPSSFQPDSLNYNVVVLAIVVGVLYELPLQEPKSWVDMYIYLAEASCCFCCQA